MTVPDAPSRLARLRARALPLSGAYPPLPGPLDAISERWARLQPRVRLLVVACAVIAMAVVVQARIQRAEQRWGGEEISVLVAAEDLPVGARAPSLRRVTLPPAAVPEGAVSDLPDEAVLALALPRGAVLTGAHLDPAGPSAGLAPGFRAVPIPVDEGWSVTPGGWVDVWVMAAGSDAVRQVARTRPVLDVSDDGSARSALVGLAAAEVGPVTEGLAFGQVLLTHAPVP